MGEAVHEGVEIIRNKAAAVGRAAGRASKAAYLKAKRARSDDNYKTKKIQHLLDEFALHKRPSQRQRKFNTIVDKLNDYQARCQFIERFPAIIKRMQDYARIINIKLQYYPETFE